MMTNVYITGCRGVPMGYGGYESFVDKLVSYQQSDKVQYWIACLTDSKYEQKQYKRAFCLPVDVPRIGPLTMPLFDILALRRFLRELRARAGERSVVYILACRIGPFIRHYVKKLHRLGVRVCLNPDGHEWKRQKWSWPIRRYWKLSERLMVKNADLSICDSKNIEKYIQEEYGGFFPRTTYISYGADICGSCGAEQAYTAWCGEHAVVPDDYYLVIGRFVPENNYETIIREFMASRSRRQLVILTNTSESRFLKRLREATAYEKDARIVFAGTVYEHQLVKRIREGAVAYIHGHEVGGTNPSLLEGLASTKVCALLDVCFNREVARDAALYFTKEKGALSDVIRRIEGMTADERNEYGERARQRILDDYDCRKISEAYEALFEGLDT